MLVLPIKCVIILYWAFADRSKRRCLFNISCSRAVYMAANEKGIIQAIRVFLYRYRNCRSGYTQVVEDAKVIEVRSCLGDNIDLHELSDWMLEPH